MRVARCCGLALVVTLALVTLAYLPGLRGPFVFDDYPNIVNHPAVAVTTLTADSLRAAATSNTSGPLARPVAALSFALDHYRAGGFDPLAFKLTNLAIHLLNVLLVYVLAGRLARRLSPGSDGRVEALFCALLWGLHPLNLTSVLYVVQRMTSLAATFTLTAVLCWLEARGRWGAAGEGAAAATATGAWLRRVIARLRGRRAVAPAGCAGDVGIVPRSCAATGPTNGWPATGWLAACGGFFALGLLTKENAVVLPLYLAAIEYCLWRRGGGTDGGRRAADRFFLITLLLPLAVGVALFVWRPGLLLDGYLARPFTLVERLLTEARVLWFYVGLVLLPTPARLGLYHDDIAVSTGLLEPWTTLLALDGWLLVAVAAVLLRRRAPAFTFAVGWFLAGHALESTVVPLEIAHEHRNYLPSLGLLFGAVCGVAAFARHTDRTPPGAVVGAMAALVLGFVTFGRAASWHSEETIIDALYRHHPQSASAQQMMGELLLKRRGDPAQAAVHYRRAHELAPWEAGYAIRALWAQHVAGEPLPHGAEVDAIARALRERVVPPTTLIALQNLADCARTPDAVCRELTPTLLAWLTAADANPTLGGNARQQVWMSYGQLCLETDRYDQGLAWVRAASARSPLLVLRLMEANFLMLQGQLDAASTRLDEVARAAGITATDAEHLAVLRDAVAKRRSAAAAPR